MPSLAQELVLQWLQRRRQAPQREMMSDIIGMAQGSPRGVMEGGQAPAMSPMPGQGPAGLEIATNQPTAKSALEQMLQIEDPSLRREGLDILSQVQAKKERTRPMYRVQEDTGRVVQRNVKESEIPSFEEAGWQQGQVTGQERAKEKPDQITYRKKIAPEDREEGGPIWTTTTVRDTPRNRERMENAGWELGTTAAGSVPVTSTNVKEADTPAGIMKRLSSIQSAIAKLNSTGSLDQIEAALLPPELLKTLKGGEGDIERAVSALETERDLLLGKLPEEYRREWIRRHLETAETKHAKSVEDSISKYVTHTR